MGGTTQGTYSLRLNFTPELTAGLVDATGSRFDGDADGKQGGNYNFWFRTQDSAHTVFVDKAAIGGTGTPGSITNPYTNVATALAAAAPGSIVRIVGNGGVDGNLATTGDNLAYNIGRDILNKPLSDGTALQVPQGVTLMIDAGAVFKLRGANIDVGSSSQGVDRSQGALQVLGTPAKDATGAPIGTVFFTSYHNETLGKDLDPRVTLPSKGDWGGLVFREDSDRESQGAFLNYVNHADMTYGGGKVIANSVQQTFNPLHMIDARPSITFNRITQSADAAMSGDPNSFEETEFQNDSFNADYRRVGPDIHGNLVTDNTINGMFVRIDTLAGQSLNPVTVGIRFDDTDIVHVISENLIIQGTPGGVVLEPDPDGLSAGTLKARLDARLAIDPGIVVKLDGARIETGMSAQLIAEGTAANPVIFTGLLDDRYGAGGTFDTTGDGLTSSPTPGSWGGLDFGELSKGSVDHAMITFAGGATTVEGGFDRFNAVEIHQADVRLTNSILENNDNGLGADRAGRGPNAPGVIFVRGAQPIIVNNIIRNTLAAPTVVNSGPAITINVSLSMPAPLSLTLRQT
jgi:hypothetical protein